MNIAIAILAVGLLVFLAHVLEDLFSRTRIPDVLFLLGLGLLLGPGLHVVGPEHLGAVGPVFTTLTLVIILFEGGLGLNLDELFHGLRGALLLTILNFFASMVVVVPMGRLLFGLPWMSATILGAILGGTSSAVVIPLVKKLSLGGNTRMALSLESALSDVLVIVVALGLMGAHQLGTLNLGAMAVSMVASFLMAGAIGTVGGLVWSLALSRIHGLQNSIFTTPAFVCVVFGTVELLGYSGAIAALAMGTVLGNLERIPSRLFRRPAEALASLNATEREVFSEVVFLLKTFFFVYIGVSIRVGGWGDLVLGSLLVGALLVVRIPVVHAALRPTGASGTDALATMALIPKGLAAAAVAGVPLQMGLASGAEIRDAAFAVVLISILATSLLIFLLERGWLAGLERVLFRRFSRPS